MHAPCLCDQISADSVFSALTRFAKREKNLLGEKMLVWDVHSMPYDCKPSDVNVCFAACVKPAAKKAAGPAERKAKQAPKAAAPPRRPPSRKPVGTPARAAGKRAASIPARLRPLDNTPYRRQQTQGMCVMHHICKSFFLEASDVWEDL